MAHGARLGAKLGVDVVKAPCTGRPETFRRVVEACFVPVVIAGGPKASSGKEVLEMVKGSMGARSAGLSMERSTLHHQNPKKILKALRSIVYQGEAAEKVMEILEANTERTVWVKIEPCRHCP